MTRSRRRAGGPRPSLERTLLSACTLAVAACSGGGSDPEPLPGDLPRVVAQRSFSDHREIDVRFAAPDGAELEGTLYVPNGTGPFATAVIQSGSTWTTRETWADVAFAIPTLGAAFSYDRRGHGASGGSCCPATDPELYDVLAGDLAAAVEAVSTLPEVDGARIGLFASSQGGWTAPLAANLARGQAAFLIVVVGGAISTGQEALYDELTGYGACERSSMTVEEIEQELREAGPSGFDPRASLVALTQPTLWMYGGQDWSHPAGFSRERLEEVMATSSKPWTIVTFPEANHSLIDGGAICEEGPPTADVLSPMEAFMAGIG